MKTRVPLDVDMEDRLIYGLSPARFGYVAVAALGAMVVWAGGRPPMILRLALALLIALAGIAAGWLTFRGRHLDDWALDALGYLARNHRIRVDRPGS